MKTLYLLDAYALIYRAYYALIRAPRINSKGENTSAIMGFVNTLADLLNNANPDLIAIAFDPAGGTFRHEAYPEYKAQREATPEAIRFAVPIIKDIIKAFNIAILEVPNYEADDVIGTVAKQAAQAGMQVKMITPDKDYAQLVADNIVMCRPGSGAKGMEVLGVNEVLAKYDLTRTEQVIDLLALMGDAADNVPGCPGVGEKTAVKLIKEYGSVENLIANAHQVKGALGKKVQENTEAIKFSKFLVTIKTDVPMDIDFDAYTRKAPNEAELLRIFEALEFRSLANRLFPNMFAAPKEVQQPKAAASKQLDLFSSLEIEEPKSAAQTDVAPDLFSMDSSSALDTLSALPHTYSLVDTPEAMDALCQKLCYTAVVAFDTETTSVDAIVARLVGMSFATAPGEAFYVPVPQDEAEAKAVVARFMPFFTNNTIEKVGQNMKYDLIVLRRYGVKVAGTLFDTMLAHYVVQPEMRHNLDLLAEIYLKYRTISIETLIGARGRNQRSMAELPPAQICDYACEDADVALRLKPILEKEMAEHEVAEVFKTIEMPLLPVLVDLERAGVRIDMQALNQTAQKFNEQMQTLENEIFEMAGHAFTLTSPRQVGEVLFGELQLSSKVKKTKTGQYSTSEEELEKLKSKHPIVEKILEHRGLKKLLSTYVEALPKLVNLETGRIHTSFNQAVTATGRLSSSNPNLQNIPIRDDNGKEIRRAFIPYENEVFLSADYSQIELRIMAHLSGDKNLVSAFCDGHDIHAATAARIFKKPLEEVTSDERRKAKTANFGIIYGISAFGLAERMNVSRTEAKELIEEYFNTYPDVKTYMDQSIEKAREKGYIVTDFGRRRYLSDIHSANAVVRGYAERNAINAPIQGTAADIIKLAMVRIAQRLEAEHLNATMMLQVHDELNFSVPQEEVEQVKQIVVEEMEKAYSMKVPLVAEYGLGDNWLVAH
jgi:DNA polymerase-1